ncbi:FlgD immunoglobulin-like domain containing protein [Chryseobacterium sp. MDT2-18]|uniref:FlgD immunoglobulin-like domain containing protein n=1 Tax=Chryseobacterium sp. MDT2-18 TaxID=1259136 RepID=UPI002782CB22|nr:FlgD immunoglobulin-like domain containing protein [Chryseobacterium sp. MDT2-18]MDQ0478066.1 putative repeat protein (TIGR01451 family) [Chryseobacterium sp. MDT2-18]
MKTKIYSWQKAVHMFRIVAVFAAILCSSLLFADGSRDLYPSGASGLRAYLRSSNSPTVNWPFPNQGVHYVYAKVGERITMASSAQDSGANSRIRLYAPDGSQLFDNATVAGQIPNRAAELAGPQLSGGSVSGRYTPIYYQVPTGKEGIYRVELVARGTGDPTATFNADATWTQGSDAGIMAWDVSLINATNTAFVPGRVYTNVLNLSNGTTNIDTKGFYGKIYTLTKDGYTYRVNNNGNNGIYFTFFVNNNGFIDATTQDPVYKSLNGSTAAFLSGKVRNPNSSDTSKNITHKMFYVLPGNDLPTSSSVSLQGTTTSTTTWLRKAVTTPHVTNVSVVGVEGVSGQVSKKGGYIKFDADVQGNYTITIEGTVANPGFVTRVLTGSSSAGANQFLWDGKDGAGNASPVGAYPIKITVRLQGAEVHFPYIDMEYNRFGTIVELLDHTQLSQIVPVVSVVSDIVYWNDVDITNATSNGSKPSPINNSHLPPVNSTGISSNTNGHNWGVGGTGVAGQFGDEKAIDTWTFIKAEEVTVNASVIVKSADLMVTSITPDRTNALEGEQVAYTIKVKNGGPDNVTGAPFLYKIPNGLSPQSILFVGNGCGSEGLAMSYDAVTHTYSSKLNLPNGCEITYVITVTVTNQATTGNQQVEAAILRTNDVTDPDATNPDITVLPTDPYSECVNNGMGGSCNNIMINNTVIVTLACYNSPATGIGVDSRHGITLLQRAGADNGNWPMIRKSAHTVLESNSKGFVITRMTTAQVGAIVSPQEGMMVYDTDAKCLKLYDGTAWSCFKNSACP